LKIVLSLLFLPFPAFGSDMLAMSDSLKENDHPTATALRFELPLSAPDAANEIPNRDTIALSSTFRLPTLYRTDNEDSRPKTLSLYKSEAFKTKPTPSPTGRPIETMQEKYRHIVAATIRSSSSMTAEILYAVMWVESEGKSKAVSRKGAQGVMQINAITQRELGLKPGEAFIPKKAIPKAAEYLETNYKIFGSWPAALLAYNIGPGNARVYLRKKKDPSRHPYVKKVLRAQSLM
jgi:hypothetical protein